MVKIINFLKKYTLQDFIVDIKFFSSIFLFIFISWFSYCMLYFILKGGM